MNSDLPVSDLGNNVIKVNDYQPKTPLPSSELIHSYALKNAIRKWGPIDVSSALRKFLQLYRLAQVNKSLGTIPDRTQFIELIYSTDRNIPMYNGGNKSLSGVARKETEILKFLFQYQESLHREASSLADLINNLFIDLPVKATNVAENNSSL